MSSPPPQVDIDEFNEKYPLSGKEDLLNSGVIDGSGFIDVERLQNEFPVDYYYLEKNGFLKDEYTLVPEKFEEHAEYLEETIDSNIEEAITKVESGPVLFVTDSTDGIGIQKSVGDLAVGVYQPIDGAGYIGAETNFFRGDISENVSTYGYGYGRYDLENEETSLGINGSIIHNNPFDEEGWSYSQSRISVGVESLQGEFSAGVAGKVYFSNNENTDATLSLGYSDHDGTGQSEVGASIERDVLSIAEIFKIQVEASYDCVKQSGQNIKCDTDVGAGFTLRF